MRLRTSGRCDECRRRKRKCSECKPSCSLCMSGGIDCVYSNTSIPFVHSQLGRSADSDLQRSQGVIVRKVTLDLRTSWDLPSGKGQYQTFATKRLKKQVSRFEPVPLNTPLPLSPVEMLSCEFGLLISQDSQSQNFSWLWQHWSAFIPSRIGSSPLLDCAIACVLEAHRAQRTAESQSVVKAQGYYGRTLHLLQDALKTSPQRVNGLAVAAAKMLESYEAMVDVGVEGWRSHADGATQLLLAAGPSMCGNDFERALLYTVYGMAWQRAIYSGQASSFDDPAWLHMSSPLPSDSQGSLAESHRRFLFFTKFPRLVNLIRTARGRPEQIHDTGEMRLLLHDLVDLELAQDPWSLATIKDHLPNAEDTVPSSIIRYHDPVFRNAFSSSLRWANRIMLCGLYQSAIVAGVHDTSMSLAYVQQEELRCARFICMSVQCMTHIKFQHNLAAALFPMQLAWGVLWRQRTDGRNGNGEWRLLAWLESQISQCALLLGLKVRREELIAYTQLVDGSPAIDEEE